MPQAVLNICTGGLEIAVLCPAWSLGWGNRLGGCSPPTPLDPLKKIPMRLHWGHAQGRGICMGCMGRRGGAGRGGCTGKGCIDMEVVHVQGASPLWVKSVPNPCCSRGAAASVGAQGPAERHISLLAGTLSSAKGLGQRLLPLAMGDQGDGSDGE